jgi:hypothetical protein
VLLLLCFSLRVQQDATVQYNEKVKELVDRNFEFENDYWNELEAKRQKNILWESV